jgi:hypothetical protein
MGNIDIDRIIQEYQDRQNAGEPEPFDSFLPPPPQYGYDDSPAPENNFFVDGDGNLTVGDGIIRPMGLDAVSEPEPVFTPPPPEPNGFFPGINPEDFEDFDFGNMDFSNIPNYQMPAPEPENNDPGRGRFYGDPMDAIMSPRYKVGAAPRLNQSALDRLIAETESLNPGMGSIINRSFFESHLMGRLTKQRYKLFSLQGAKIFVLLEHLKHKHLHLFTHHHHHKYQCKA